MHLTHLAPCIAHTRIPSATLTARHLAGERLSGAMIVLLGSLRSEIPKIAIVAASAADVESIGHLLTARLPACPASLTAAAHFIRRLKIDQPNLKAAKRRKSKAAMMEINIDEGCRGEHK